MAIAEPCVVNKFATEAEAVAAAKAWSADQVFAGEWTVVHAPSETGLAFFVERGDGGSIHMSERFVATYRNGRKVRA